MSMGMRDKKRKKAVLAAYAFTFARDICLPNPLRIL